MTSPTTPEPADPALPGDPVLPGGPVLPGDPVAAPNPVAAPDPAAVPDPADERDTVPLPGAPPGRRPRQRFPAGHPEPPPPPPHHPVPAAASGTVPRAPRKRLRHPAVGLPATVLLGLLAAFFGWQAAVPLWLAAGAGTDGTAIPSRCDATGGTVAGEGTDPAVSYPCITFEAADGSFRAVDVTLLGAGPDPTGPDPVRPDHVPARMVSPDGSRAYATDPAGLHLRWSVGLLLVLACAAGIAWATGARRLAAPRSRRRAVLLSFAGPLLLTAGFVAAAGL